MKRIDAGDPSYARTRKVVRRKNYPVKYTEDDVIGCLQEANAALGGILTTAAYDNYARGRTELMVGFGPPTRRRCFGWVLGSPR